MRAVGNRLPLVVGGVKTVPYEQIIIAMGEGAVVARSPDPQHAGRGEGNGLSRFQGANIVQSLDGTKSALPPCIRPFR